ncbi:MAG: CBS domain-containing protein [Planctomycetes bacterium]|nr:CBS domain-containing protein [Planctomycetota bacterium]
MSEIASIMSTHLVTVTKKNTVLEAIDLLVKHNITGLPVVDRKMRLVGVVSEKDVLTLVYCLKTKTYDSRKMAQTVENVMTTEVVSFDINDRLSDVCKCLMDSGFRRVPILSDGKLAGIISRKDLLQAGPGGSA